VPSLSLTQNSEFPYAHGHLKRVLITSPAFIRQLKSAAFCVGG